MILQFLNIKELNISSIIFAAHWRTGQPEFYNELDSKLKEIGIEIKILPFSEINLNKPWIIDVRLNTDNLRFDGDIIGDFNEAIQHELLHGNAYLLINHDMEGDTNFIRHLYTTLIPKTKIDPRKIIYLTHTEGAGSVVKELAYQPEKQIITIFSPHIFYKIPDNDLNYFNDSNHFNYSPRNKIKKYLFLNRMPRPHRVMMASMLAYYDCLKYGYVSLGPDAAKIYKKWTDVRISIGLDLIIPNLPLTIDIDDFNLNPTSFISLPIQFWAETYFSLISSTHCLKNDEIGVSLNEKEMKPLLAKHPFLIVGKPYSLQHLKNLGYMTFERWFDESYDTETDDIKRFEMIALETKRLSLLSDDQWSKMLDEMKPVLLHNQNRAFKYGSDICYFTGDLKKFLWFVA